jgi:hypothetical protein
MLDVSDLVVAAYWGTWRFAKCYFLMARKRASKAQSKVIEEPSPRFLAWFLVVGFLMVVGCVATEYALGAPSMKISHYRTSDNRNSSH